MPLSEVTDLARHAADTLTDYRLHPEDLPAQVGVMVYEHPPVEGTAAARHNAVSQQGIVRIGRTLARLPRDEVLARARTAAARDLPEPTPENKSSDSDETADQVADHVLATFLPNLERAPVPPSFVPPHG